MNTKSFLTSKTFWVQVLTAASGFIPAVQTWVAQNPVEVLAALAAINTLIRFATSGRVTLFGGEPPSPPLWPPVVVALLVAGGVVLVTPSCTTMQEAQVRPVVDEFGCLGLGGQLATDEHGNRYEIAVCPDWSVAVTWRSATGVQFRAAWQPEAAVRVWYRQKEGEQWLEWGAKSGLALPADTPEPVREALREGDLAGGPGERRGQFFVSEIVSVCPAGALLSWQDPAGFRAPEERRRRERLV